jgi:hypothetical protein
MRLRRGHEAHAARPGSPSLVTRLQPLHPSREAVFLDALDEAPLVGTGPDHRSAASTGLAAIDLPESSECLLAEVPGIWLMARHVKASWTKRLYDVPLLVVVGVLIDST